jgi:carboxymethylenebutenolidase
MVDRCRRRGGRRLGPRVSVGSFVVSRRLQHPTQPPLESPSWSAGERVAFGGLTDRGVGYMSYSERVGPSVLVLPEAYGLTSSIESYVDRLVEEGFTALAPDIYEGRTASTLAEARALAAEVWGDRTGPKGESLRRTLVAAARHLVDNWHPRLGIVGFSSGGTHATWLIKDVERDATVVYYGFDDDALDPGAWRGPLIGHFGDADDLLPPGPAREKFIALEDAGHEVEFNLYPGATHSFANADQDSFDEDLAEAAWERTLETLYYFLS